MFDYTTNLNNIQQLREKILHKAFFYLYGGAYVAKTVSKALRARRNSAGAEHQGNINLKSVFILFFTEYLLFHPAHYHGKLFTEHYVEYEKEQGKQSKRKRLITGRDHIAEEVKVVAEAACQLLH